ncbi:unnamed protein product [Prunus armeniaca]
MRIDLLWLELVYACDMLGSALLSSFSHVGSYLTYLGPLKLLVGEFIHPSLFINESKVKVSNQVNLPEELSNQKILVFDSLERIVWSPIACRLGFRWRCAQELQTSSVVAKEETYVVAPISGHTWRQRQDGREQRLQDEPRHNHGGHVVESHSELEQCSQPRGQKGEQQLTKELRWGQGCRMWSRGFDAGVQQLIQCCVVMLAWTRC